MPSLWLSLVITQKFTAMSLSKRNSELDYGHDEQRGFRSAASMHQNRKQEWMPNRFVYERYEKKPNNAYRKRLRRYFAAMQYRFYWLYIVLRRNGNWAKISVVSLSFVAVMYIGKRRETVPEEPVITAIPVETTLELTPGVKPKKAKQKKAEEQEIKSTPEPAPASPKELPKDATGQYIRKYAEMARKEMAKFGIPASISLAQGLIESRAGTSKLARLNNNHFGMKCFSKNCSKGHCTNHSDDSHKDFFRNFPNAWDSWRAHSQMISSGRYAKLKQYGRDYRRWAQGLQSLGYATDKTYAKKLIGMIERYDLHRYDR